MKLSLGLGRDERHLALSYGPTRRRAARRAARRRKIQ